MASPPALVWGALLTLEPELEPPRAPVNTSSLLLDPDLGETELTSRCNLIHRQEKMLLKRGLKPVATATPVAGLPFWSRSTATSAGFLWHRPAHPLRDLPVHVLANLVRKVLKKTFPVDNWIGVPPAGPRCRAPAGTVARAPSGIAALGRSCSQCREPGKEQVSGVRQGYEETDYNNWQGKHFFSHLNQFLLLDVAAGVVVVLLAGAGHLDVYSYIHMLDLKIYSISLLICTVIYSYAWLDLKIYCISLTSTHFLPP